MVSELDDDQVEEYTLLHLLQDTFLVSLGGISAFSALHFYKQGSKRFEILDKLQTLHFYNTSELKKHFTANPQPKLCKVQAYISKKQDYFIRTLYRPDTTLGVMYRLERQEIEPKKPTSSRSTASSISLPSFSSSSSSLTSSTSTEPLTTLSAYHPVIPTEKQACTFSSTLETIALEDSSSSDALYVKTKVKELPYGPILPQITDIIDTKDKLMLEYPLHVAEDGAAIEVDYHIPLAIKEYMLQVATPVIALGEITMKDNKLEMAKTLVFSNTSEFELIQQISSQVKWYRMLMYASLGVFAFTVFKKRNTIFNLVKGAFNLVFRWDSKEDEDEL